MFADFQDYLSLDPQEALTAPLFYYSLLIIFILGLSWWVIKRTKTELVTVFSDDDGTVHITPQALRELVRKTCANIPGVHLPTTKISQRSKLIRLQVKLRVDPHCKVKEVRSQLKVTLEEVMIENLNFANFSGIDIIIKGFQDTK